MGRMVIQVRRRTQTPDVRRLLGRKVASQPARVHLRAVRVECGPQRVRAVPRVELEAGCLRTITARAVIPAVPTQMSRHQVLTTAAVRARAWVPTDRQVNRAPKGTTVESAAPQPALARLQGRVS